MYLAVLGVIGVGEALGIGRSVGPSRDCPFCRGTGCARCGWSGEVDSREIDRATDEYDDAPLRPGADSDPDDGHDLTVDRQNGVSL